MLDSTTKKRIDDIRDILVGKVTNPIQQVEQITVALIYKFMDDMDMESVEMGGERKFFSHEFEKFAWSNLFSSELGGTDRVKLYEEAMERMELNPYIPQLFRNIFKNAYLPYRDPETLRNFLKYINDFNYSHSEKLGDAFEYLLSILGSQGDAGQFRTPRHIIDFMAALIDPQKEETILDPACGTAGFLISAYKHILKANSSNYDAETDKHAFEMHGVNLDELTINGKLYKGDLLTPDERNMLTKNVNGYDISPDMVRLSLVNMYLHGFPDPHIYEYDTLTSDERWNEFYDVILANPPFMSPKGGIRPHKRFSVQSKRSEVLFVDYMAEHLTANGKAAIVVPEGIIFQTGTAYKSLRKMLVDENYLVGVISLPAGVFNPYSGVKTSILWLDKKLARKTDNILFAKITNDGFDLGAQRRSIKLNDLPEAFKKMINYRNALQRDERISFDDDPIVSIVSKKLIEGNGDYNLSGERYKITENVNSEYHWIKIGEAAQFIKDGDWIESKDQSESGIRLLQTGNIGIGRYLGKKHNARFISADTFTRLNCTEVKPGDVLVSRLPDPVGRACLAPDLPSKMITAVDCSIIRFKKDKLLPELFVNYTKSDAYYKQLAGYLTGSSRRRISRKNLEAVEIPLPPISIQEEIVAEIESYQKIIDGARQVVDNYKPHIDIDPDWEMVELGEVFNKITKSVLPIDLKVDSVDYIGLENISQGTGFKVGNTKANPNEIKSTKTIFAKGDILYGKLRPNLNKVYFSEIEGICSTDIFVLRGTERVIPKLYSYYFLSPLFNQTVLKGIKGAQLPRVGFEYFKTIKVPIPEIEIQQQIVTRIEQEQQLVNANKQLIEIYEQKIKDRIGKIWGG